MYFLGRSESSFLFALLTKRMLLDVSVTDAFPLVSVPTLVFFVGIGCLFGLGSNLLVYLAELLMCKSWASGISTRMLWSSWYCYHRLSDIIKALAGLFPQRLCYRIHFLC